MAEKCIGVREDTGAKCNRSAGRDSDFCFMHQSQEGNQKLQHLDDDVYYCPHDGKKLLYDPKRDYHRCKKCRGSLFSGKMISSDYARKISQSSQVQHEEKCCSCLEGDGLSIHVIEATYIGGGHRSLFGDIISLAAGRIHTVVRVWLCNNCGSVWVEGTLLQKARISFRGAEYLEWLFSDGFNVNLNSLDPILDDLVASAVSDENLNWFEQQEKWRDIRLGKAEKGREKAESRLKLCNHVDDSGKECNVSISQKSNHDRDFCWKHQPK